MGAKNIADDNAKELTLAAGECSKVKHNRNMVVIIRGDTKVKPLAFETTDQKLTDVSTMIGNG